MGLPTGKKKTRTILTWRSPPCSRPCLPCWSTCRWGAPDSRRTSSSVSATGAPEPSGWTCPGSAQYIRHILVWQLQEETNNSGYVVVSTLCFAILFSILLAGQFLLEKITSFLSHVLLDVSPSMADSRDDAFGNGVTANKAGIGKGVPKPRIFHSFTVKLLSLSLLPFSLSLSLSFPSLPLILSKPGTTLTQQLAWCLSQESLRINSRHCVQQQGWRIVSWTSGLQQPWRTFSFLEAQNIHTCSRTKQTSIKMWHR